MRRRLLPFAIAALLLAPLHAQERAVDTAPAPAQPQPSAVDTDAAPAPPEAREPATAPVPSAPQERSDAEDVDAEDGDAAREGDAAGGEGEDAAQERAREQAQEQAPAPVPPSEREQARAVTPATDPDAAESASSRVPLEEIRRYVAVYNAIKDAYVEPVEDRELMQSAIRGLLLDLDPHSVYLDRDDAEAFDESTTGAYSGIGVEVIRMPEGSLRVVAPIDDTPAARAGIRTGDVIVAADGETLTPSSHEGTGPLRGEPGTSVLLTVLRDGAAEPLEIPVERETIRVASVRGRLLEPGYGYIRISAFQVDTAADFQRTLRELQEKAPLRGLVLDLRTNPGGLLTSAVQIADDLLDEGGIVSTRGRISISDAEFSATPGDLLEGVPVVVIVDAGSASASEVLAGALRDNGRARILGSRTFGKGSVQTLLPLDNGDSVKLTTARYYTPSGRSIQARGIDPDVVLEPESRPASVARDYSEASLPGHLRGDEEGLPGDNAGDVLDGDGPIEAALAELKKLLPPLPVAASTP